MSATPTIVRVADAEAVAVEGARLVRETIREAVAARGRCAVALAGGRTPRGVYQRLTDLDWAGVDLWFGDERHVPPDHADSNYRMVREALLAPARIPDAQVHRIATELPDAARAAADYEDDLRRVFGLAPGGIPTLDLALLGMGPDGHTASLFPGTPAVSEEARLATAVWVDRLQTWRVTLTTPVFNHARRVLVFVTGADKADMLSQVLAGPRDPLARPIQGISPVDGELTFLVDEPAAVRLRRG